MFKNKFDFTHLKGDLFGGITAGIVALPLALAFGVSSGLGPQAGLYGAIFLGFFAALFGGTPTQISGPTAPVTAVSMVVIASIVAMYNGHIASALPSILIVFLMAGVLQILMGITGIGMYIRYIPYPVVSGFMTAIGLIIIITQLLPILGYYPKEDNGFVNQFKAKAKEVLIKDIVEDKTKNNYTTTTLFEAIQAAENIDTATIDKEAKTIAANQSSGVVGAVKSLPKALKNINRLEFILAVCTIAIIYGFKKITTKVPSTLVALVTVSFIAWLTKLPYRSIDEIPGGFPHFHFEIFNNIGFSNISPYIFTALTIALLGSIDSLLTSVVADNMTKTKHNPNKELIGQGIGNSMSAFFGGLPGAGATIRTVVNINAGAKTRLSGMVAGILLLFIMMAMAPVASKIPAAVLAGILFTVGLGVMDYKGLKAMPHMPKDTKIGPLKVSSEVLIMIVVMLLSTFWNLVYAVGIGLVIAALMFMKKMGDITAKKSVVKPMSQMPAEAKWADENDFPERLKEEVFIKRLNGPLFFGVTDEIKELSQSLPKTAKYLVMRMDNVPYIDQSGVYTLEDIFMEMENREIEVLLVNVQSQPEYMLNRIKIIPDLIPQKYIFQNFEKCLRWIEENVKDEN